MIENVLFDVSKGSQISIFLDNEPGALSKVCRLLGEKDINIHGLTVADGIDHGYLRMVVDGEKEAEKILDAAGYMAFVREIMLIEISNIPGALGVVTTILSENSVNMDYAYCAGGPNVDRGLVVVYVDDVDKAINCLSRSVAD